MLNGLVGRLAHSQGSSNYVGRAKWKQELARLCKYKLEAVTMTTSCCQ